MRIPHFSNMQVARAIVTTRQNSKQIIRTAQRVIPQPVQTKKSLMTAVLFASSIVPHGNYRQAFKPQTNWGEKISVAVSNVKKSFSKKIPIAKPKPKAVTASNLKLMAEGAQENPKVLCSRFNDLLLENDKGKNLLNGRGKAYIRSSKKYGVDPVVVMAISLHESGRGISSYTKKYHNVGGIMSGGKIKQFRRVEDCIDQIAETLSIHNDKSNIQTVKELAKAGKYCKKEEAKEWLDGVMFYVKRLKGIES